jgi:hypothetical protein
MREETSGWQGKGEEEQTGGKRLGRKRWQRRRRRAMGRRKGKMRGRRVEDEEMKEISVCVCV